VKSRCLWYALPLAMFAPDAYAWGLQTHLFFAQCAVFLVPFADRELRAAVSRFPRLVLAGACLPDLALAALFAAGARRFAAPGSPEKRSA